jgi:cytochrome c oxidase subunit 3
MHFAVHSARRRTLWLSLTMLLGAAFLANLLSEYASNSFGIDDNAYGSIYYLLTGFHGLHVLGGLLFMAAVIWSLRGRSDVPAGTAIEVCSYYWHFVDVVWLAMFTTLFVVR